MNGPHQLADPFPCLAAQIYIVTGMVSLPGVTVDGARDMQLPAAGIELQGKDRFCRTIPRPNVEDVPGLKELPQAGVGRVEQSPLMNLPRDFFGWAVLPFQRRARSAERGALRALRFALAAVGWAVLPFQNE